MEVENPGGRERYRAAEHVRFTVIDGTAMLMDVRRERYLGLNEVGTRIFELASGGREPDQLVAELEREFAVEPERLRQDVRRMLAELEREGLLERCAEPG